MEPFATDPIQNHVKASAVGREIHDRVRRELEQWYEASHPTVAWHSERLGPPAYDKESYSPYSWEGEHWTGSTSRSAPN